MRLLLVCAVTLLFAACRSSKNSSQASENGTLLQGEWVLTNGKEHRGIFSFGDTLCSYGYPFGRFTRYWAWADSLSILTKESHTDPEFGEPVVYTFTKQHIGPDTLLLTPINKYGEALMGELGIKGQLAIALARIQRKNEIMPTRITFYSSVCFGTCPSMYLDIDQDGDMRFYGVRFTNPEGGHVGKLDETLHNWILRKVQQLPLHKIDRWYKAPWTDDQTVCVTIEWDDEILQSCAYGMNEEPIELRILFHHLIQLYNQIELTPSDIQIEDFRHTDMMDER